MYDLAKNQPSKPPITENNIIPKYYHDKLKK